MVTAIKIYIEWNSRQYPYPHEPVGNEGQQSATHSECNRPVGKHRQPFDIGPYVIGIVLVKCLHRARVAAQDTHRQQQSVNNKTKCKNCAEPNADVPIPDEQQNHHSGSTIRQPQSQMQEESLAGNVIFVKQGHHTRTEQPVA